MSTLFARMHQLANRHRRRRNDAGGQGGGEDIRPANQAQHVEFRMVRDAKPANCPDRFGEGPDDEINIVFAAQFLEHAATVLAAEAHRSEEHTSELQSLMRSSYAVV